MALKKQFEALKLQLHVYSDELIITIVTLY